MAGLAFGGYALAPTVKTMMETVSTDDAYVNGHVTYVAPRVAGQVSRVLVDDNDRVSKGDLLVQLDREPYQVQVDLKKAAVVNAEADVEAARAQVRGILAQARSQRWKLQRAIEDVDDKVAQLKARVAALRSREASLDRARADFARAQQLFNRGAIAREEFDQRREAVRTAEAAVKQALEEVHEARVALGLDPHPEGKDLTDVPADLNQTFSGVSQALNELLQSMTQAGYPLGSSTHTPRQALDEFARRDKEGNIDRILERMVPEAPAVRQAEAKLLQARRDLAQAELNLRYCDVVSEIDGVVTSTNVNPGNNVSAGQSLMTVRSLTEIWVDANFKETQLADLRIGQRVRCEVDMYGGRHGVRGPHQRLHHGDRADPGPAAAAERHGQLREDRPAAAGADRADRLRPGQGPPVRRPVGRPPTCTTRSRPRGRTPGRSCDRSARARRVAPCPATGKPRNRRPPFPTAAAALDG